MMTMRESTNILFGGVGKGDRNCDSDSDGNSDSGSDAFNNKKKLQAGIEWRRGLTVEEGAMMTTTESTNVPFGRRWRWRLRGQRQQWWRWRGGGDRNRDHDRHCNGDGNGDGNGNGVSSGSSGNDDGGDKEGNEDESKPGLGEGGALLTRRTRETTPSPRRPKLFKHY
jgi:hypothetical protein